MSELPKIDPSWTRRPRPPAKDDSYLGHIITTVIVLSLLVWLGRTHFESEAVRQAAAESSNAQLEQADLRQKQVQANDEVTYISEAEADRQIAAASSPGQDDSIRRCVSGSADTYQLGACRAPYVEAGYAPANSRQQNIAEQERMRLDAEAKLRAEQQRFAALTGQASGSWQQGYSSSPNQPPRQRCAMTKAERDAAYRAVGNNRSFEFIRFWDEAVYAACKDT